MMIFLSENRKQLLAIFDVEGVLYDAEYLPILAEKVNKEDEIWEITKQGIQGKINWEEGLRTRVSALKGLDEKGLIFLYAVPWPAQGLYSKKEINSVDDLKGLKFRAYNSATIRIA